MSLLALRDSHDTESSSSSTNGGITKHLIDAIDSRIDLARHTITAILALDLDPKIRHHMAERRRRLQVNRVPANLEIGIPVGNGVGSSHIRRPVTVRIGRGTPNTAGFCSDAGRVDIVALRRQYRIIISESHPTY